MAKPSGSALKPYFMSVQARFFAIWQTCWYRPESPRGQEWNM